MRPRRHVRIFRNGRNQTIRIPREFELDADEALLYREDDRLIVEPVNNSALMGHAAHNEDGACIQAPPQLGVPLQAYRFGFIA